MILHNMIISDDETSMAATDVGADRDVPHDDFTVDYQIRVTPSDDYGPLQRAMAAVSEFESTALERAKSARLKEALVRAMWQTKGSARSFE